ncbi:hypothetical protein SteCoe_3800 [Stentor coeruleus]|uniref:Uncharacterized protein n=1 Tax=Stentor coeruleus TaxID=5963 RepID=A0A1R2CW51_9CILI|nr:hypothetical protein SteCoe_3800 [Stentor coeruleus]
MHMESSPQCKIGKSLRVFRSQIDYPGPGSYSPKDFSKASPRATIGKSVRTRLKYIEETPGPGKYEKSFSKLGPSFTFQGPRERLKPEAFPGPGCYNLTLYSKAKMPAYGIGKAKRNSFSIPCNPGPGTYNLSTDKSGPVWTVGNERRFSTSQTDFASHTKK